MILSCWTNFLGTAALAKSHQSTKILLQEGEKKTKTM
jgi:hypothetical protein